MSLSTDQQQLLFDYCLGMTTGEEATQAQVLIRSRKRAAEIYGTLQSVLSPLSVLAAEPCPCPDALAERTIARLTEAKLVDSGPEELDAVLEKERAWLPTLRFSFWRNFGNVVAAAAGVMLLAGVLVPSLGYARQKHWQQQCQGRLGTVFQGVSAYVSDHNGLVPALGRKAGDPWWQVGRPGRENHSNTRSAWVLVRNYYVGPEKFVCPAVRRGDELQFGTLQVQDYNDFPGRAYVGFSFRVCGPNAEISTRQGRAVFMADLNPLAERFPSDYRAPVKIRLSPELLAVNSANHSRRGQNVMSCDGSVQFTKTRQVGDPQDDIFTLQEMRCGCEVNGCEVPSCETDVFVF